MQDLLSQQPGPNIIVACNDVLGLINIPEDLYQKYYEISSDRVKNYIKKIILQNGEMCSYICWVQIASNHYATKTIDYLNKRKNARFKIKSYIKTLGLLYLIYRKTIQRYYRPEGGYESKMSLHINTLLKSW